MASRLESNSSHIQLFFGFFEVRAELGDSLFDFVAVVGGGEKLEIARVGFEGVALEALSLLSFAEEAEGDGVAGLGQGGVLEAVDGGVHVTFVQIVLAHFHVFFGAQGIPSGLVGSILRGVVGAGVGF